MKKHLLFWLFIFGILGTGTAQTPEQKLNQAGFQLTTPPAPMANYVRTVRTGNLVFLSGHGPTRPDGTLMKGKVGADVTIAQAQEAARWTALNLLSSLKAEIGDLAKVKRIVKVLGMVNATPEFTEHPQVINGFSDLMVQVFGDKGRHARSAIGLGSLPSGMVVEIEMIVEVE